MAWSRGLPGAAVSERTEQAWRFPIGAVSPLWMLFGAAAASGAAYWWLTQWTRKVNVEALAGLAPAESPPFPVARPLEIVAPAAPEPVLAEPEAQPALPRATVIEAADDLTRMTGIGPKLLVALAERGVTRFAQIAAWTEADLAEVDAALSLKGRAVREAWVAQAKRLAANA